MTDYERFRSLALERMHQIDDAKRRHPGASLVNEIPDATPQLAAAAHALLADIRFATLVGLKDLAEDPNKFTAKQLRALVERIDEAEDTPA